MELLIFSVYIDSMVHVSVQKLSPKQVQRLRNKHGVRVMEGSGFTVDVSENNAKKLKKAFAKKKGATLQLSADEVEANRGMQGSRLFDGLKKAGKSVSKAVKSASKSGIAKAVEKDVKSAVKQVKKGVSSPEDMKNLVIDGAVGALPYVGNETKAELKKGAKKATTTPKVSQKNRKERDYSHSCGKRVDPWGMLAKQWQTLQKRVL